MIKWVIFDVGETLFCERRLFFIVIIGRASIPIRNDVARYPRSRA